ncbi:hypothetical protein UFOVP225_3 [uncultured Caudovirales phage]|uniref:CBM-cenC domain-containing protein n=1 Tax=uncultured Caudovirales phage TaxID=2100421 RepID=A0A6J7WQ96_9CAUD|nr:hypothetical protein UFOVP113_16 [uncultured Caudovirales phage]CAB5218892.1 hypothetical protein UFOVP225_3 [uncultured Caudovirales phage]
MALYGSNFYNIFKYGADTLADFDARPIYSNPTDYKTISVWWTKPSGTWSNFALVRSSLGFPTTPDDGITLISTTFAGHDSLQFPFVDTGEDFAGGNGLAEGQTYYYSVFVQRTSDSVWFRAGNTLCISVKDYGTAAMMYNYLPTPYKVTDFNTSISPSSEANLDLYKFLKVFAFEYDLIKTTAENVKNRYNIRLLDGRLIPLMMDQFGWTYESEMGIAQGRRLLQYATQIYLTKGSLYGVKAFAKAFSGYGINLKSPANLMLTVEDSSAEYTVGSWNTVSNGTVASVTGASESPVVQPYAESTAPSNFPNAQTGLLKVTASASGGTVAVSCGESAPVTKGIPVTAGLNYTFTIYARSKTTARSVSTNIKWYTSAGVYISSGTAVATTTTTSGWTRLTRIIATAPSNAQFAVPTISIASTAANEVHYFDAAQFEKSNTKVTAAGCTATTAVYYADHSLSVGDQVTITGLSGGLSGLNQTNVNVSAVASGRFYVSGTYTATTTATSTTGLAAFSLKDFVDARRVDIYLQPSRINYIKNCSFEGTVTTAWLQRNGTIAASSTVSKFNAKSLEHTVGSSATSAGVSVSPSPIYMPPTIPGKDYAFSIYIRDSATAPTGKSYKCYIDWYDSDGAFISGVSISGTAVTPTSTDWVRASVTGVAPVNAVYARPYVYSSTAFVIGDSGKKVYFDGALFEPGNTVNDYFDGYNGYKQSADLLWENNDPVLGRSMYYKNRVNTTIRLKNIMGDYIDIGSPWAIFVGTII